MSGLIFVLILSNLFKSLWSSNLGIITWCVIIRFLDKIYFFSISVKSDKLLLKLTSEFARYFLPKKLETSFPMFDRNQTDYVMWPRITMFWLQQNYSHETPNTNFENPPQPTRWSVLLLGKQTD